MDLRVEVYGDKSGVMGSPEEEFLAEADRQGVYWQTTDAISSPLSHCKLPSLLDIILVLQYLILH